VKKTKRKNEHYSVDAELPASIVSEPHMEYLAVVRAKAPRSAVLMGMDGNKDYASLNNDNDTIGLIRRGIPRQAMTNLMAIADLTLLEMAAITHTSDRTLRRYKPQEKLPQEQSERLIELANLYARGEEVLGTMDAFVRWMDTELLPLGQLRPKDYLDTSIGIRLLMDELGKIQHGIFA
jgi:putative toxin-antitoxin system antitoxin component (TIGR02293 family)